MCIDRQLNPQKTYIRKSCECESHANPGKTHAKTPRNPTKPHANPMQNPQENYEKTL